MEQVERLLVAVDRAVGISPDDLASAWDEDDEARRVGPAEAQAPLPEDFLGDVLALVVIPLTVNLVSSAACVLVSRLIAKLRPRPESGDLEVVATSDGTGDLVVVVRVAESQP